MLAVPAMRARGFDMLGDVRGDSDGCARPAAVLARVGLKGKERELAKDLSYGDRRALEIGVALGGRAAHAVSGRADLGARHGGDGAARRADRRAQGAI